MIAVDKKKLSRIIQTLYLALSPSVTFNEDIDKMRIEAVKVSEKLTRRVYNDLCDLACQSQVECDHNWEPVPGNSSYEVCTRCVKNRNTSKQPPTMKRSR